MKNLVYLTSVSFLACFLTLFSPINTYGQSSHQSGIPKDSTSKEVLFSTSTLDPIGSSNAVSITYNDAINGPVQSQSALTGPGKVVTVMVILSCLFFYFNRKK